MRYDAWGEAPVQTASGASYFSIFGRAAQMGYRAYFRAGMSFSSSSVMLWAVTVPSPMGNITRT